MNAFGGKGGPQAIVSCRSCGQVTVPVEEVTVTMGHQFTWLTTCPGCGHAVIGQTEDGAIVARLVAGGAQVNASHLADHAAWWLSQVAPG